MHRLVILSLWVLVLTSQGWSQEKGSIQFPAGGHAYIKNIMAGDSSYYFLPIRALIPLKDSLRYADAGYLYTSFGEGNLSLHPSDSPVFRLLIEAGRLAPVIITLTEQGLLVKQHVPQAKGSPWQKENPEQLAGIEKEHYSFLRRYFPFAIKRNYPQRQQRYMDSMLTLYPKLRNAEYYHYLKEKAIDKNAEPFKYFSKKIILTGSQFNSLVTLINASGYWKMPFRISCIGEAADGFGFSLEANTTEKYNMVTCGICGYNAAIAKLRQACQQMVEYAQIDPVYTIWLARRK